MQGMAEAEIQLRASADNKKSQRLLFVCTLRDPAKINQKNGPLQFVFGIHY